MTRTRGVYLAVLFLYLFAASGLLSAQDASEPAAAVPTGKAPIIIVPGLTGSELVNRKTGEEVWFKARRAKDDDIRLPISANLARSRDDLVPRDIIRSVKFLKILPESEIYERLINALETRGGYKEAKWDAPGPNGHQDVFYVFSYDWRRDNVENARLLIRRIEALKRKLKKPGLEFNVIAHSMGGLITRYAAMYGSADVAAVPRPTWAGARHFDKAFLLGTPNEGSVMSLSALLNGFSYIGGGLNLPFIQNISRFDVFTMPAVFQLLPHDGTFLAFGADLKPIKVDLYDPAEWEKYGWSIWKDKDFEKKFDAAEQRAARAYFRTALRRAKLFQAALNADTPAAPVDFHLVGADCKETANAVLLLHDTEKNTWETRFKADSFTRADGEKVNDQQLKSLLFADGDSVVTKRSLSGQTLNVAGRRTLNIASEIYQCEGHSRLVTNPEIQDKLFALLHTAAASKTASGQASKQAAPEKRQ